MYDENITQIVQFFQNIGSVFLSFGAVIISIGALRMTQITDKVIEGIGHYLDQIALFLVKRPADLGNASNRLKEIPIDYREKISSNNKLIWVGLGFCVLGFISALIPTLYSISIQDLKKLLLQ